MRINSISKKKIISHQVRLLYLRQRNGIVLEANLSFFFDIKTRSEQKKIFLSLNPVRHKGLGRFIDREDMNIANNIFTYGTRFYS